MSREGMTRFAALAFPRRIGWRDHVVGLSLAIVYVAWLLATARSLGFARDEGFYFRAATDYARWFEVLLTRPADALQRGTIDGIWSTNHEHPALMKSLFALSWMTLHNRWHVFADASTAFRFPGMVMMGVGLWVTYLFGARAYSRRAGVIGAVLLGLMPHVFYNAHLACFDIPIMAMWAWCIYVYWRSQVERGIGWALAAGVMYGLTLETKHNAWILPAVFLPHALVVHGRAMVRQLRAGRLPIPTALVAMATIGPLVFYALWPWMWNDTLPRLQEYLNFHLNHEYYNIEFLGVNYFNAPSPRAYMPVLILASVPTVTLVLFAIGAYGRAAVHARRLVDFGRALAGKAASMRATAPVDRAETDLLIALAFAAPLAVFLLPKTPIFGGTKHWMPAYPFLCILAGYGFDRVATAMSATLATLPAFAANVRARVLAQAGLVALVVLAPLAVTSHSHPFGLSAYVPLVGGTAGGADLGLNRQFWGFTTESLAGYFAANAPPGATVYFHDTAWDSWARLLDEKRLRPDLRGVGSPSEADFAIVHHELHMAEVDYNIWMTMGTDVPDYVLTHDGVPIISVYRRRK
jgi:4-amino-4-deoxy-L-arabinose transferase-like glycosyltransferase